MTKIWKLHEVDDLLLQLQHSDNCVILRQSSLDGKFCTKYDKTTEFPVSRQGTTYKLSCNQRSSLYLNTFNPISKKSPF